MTKLYRTSFFMLISILIGSANAGACADFKGIQPDQGALLLKFETSAGKEEIADDDGMFVAGIIASHCAEELYDRATPDLTQAQIDCARSKVDIFIPGRLVEANVDKINAACGFNHRELLKKAQVKWDAEPLKCPGDTGKEADKVIAQYGKVAAAQSSKAFLDRLEVTAGSKSEFTKSLQHKQDLLNRLKAMMATRSSRSELKAWLADFRDAVKSEKFSRTTASGKSIAAGDDLLAEVGAGLTGKSGLSMCGLSTVDILKQVSTADWPSGKTPSSKPNGLSGVH